MNTPNPLLPQGSLPSKATSKIGFKILMILAIHVVVIGGLLLQGCSKDKATTTSTSGTEVAAATNTSPMSTTPEFTPAPVASNNVVSAPAATPAMTTPTPVASTGNLSAAPMTQPMVSTPVAAPVVASGTATEYVIASGDLLSTIAKKNGVTVKALLEANPGIEPKKLQIGHKIQIPAGSAVVAKASSSTSAVAEAADVPAGDGTTYKVKAGDRLIKIASTHGTTVKAIEAQNGMKTASIRAGQILKMPPMKVASADTTPASATTTTASASGAASSMPVTKAN